MSDETLRKAIKLLEALAEPCQTSDDDHAWRECRRCLAVEELEHKGTRELIKAVLAAVPSETLRK